MRVTRVLVGHGGHLAVADIAHRAKLTLPSVRAALRRLQDMELVTAVGAGRSTVCAIRVEHPLAPALVNLFEAEREQVAALLRAIREVGTALQPAPLALWLYGSVARGDDRPASDIDVALVSARSQLSGQAEALRRAIDDAAPAWAHRVSVVALGPGDVRRLVREEAKFWRELERDAVVLAGEAPAGVRELVTERPDR